MTFFGLSGSIGNNLFVSVITNNGKVVYIQSPQMPPRWEPDNGIGIMKNET